MNDFSDEWLHMREPLDVASRSSELAAIVAEALRPTGTRDRPIHVVDLGAGTGANLRYLAPLLGGSQDWLLVERNPSLLDALNDRMRTWAGSSGAHVFEGEGQLIVRTIHFECRIRYVALDLATQLDRVVLPQRCLVTASAPTRPGFGRLARTIGPTLDQCPSIRLFHPKLQWAHQLPSGGSGRSEGR